MTITAVRTERPTELSGGGTSALAVQDDHLWSPVTQFTLSGLTADAGDAFEMWGLARTAGRSWTLLSATGATAAAVGAEMHWDETVCSVVQAGTEAVHVADLRRRKDPVLRTASERWGIRAYVGAPVLAPGGERLGSLCGWSATPSTTTSACAPGSPATPTSSAPPWPASCARSVRRARRRGPPRPRAATR
jgi:hypothetical protein